MKRPLLSALIVGLVIVGLVLALRAGGVFAGPERAITDLLLRQATATWTVSSSWQYLFVFFLASVVAWMTLRTTRRAQLGAIIAILLVELAGVAWVCSLYRVLFQPLPSLLGAALGFLLPIGGLELAGFTQRRRDPAPAVSPE